MFSNGSEYYEFLEKNCFVCSKYDSEDPKCPVELSIIAFNRGYEEVNENFPYDKLKEVDYMCRYICKEIELKEEYKHLQEVFDKELKEDLVNDLTFNDMLLGKLYETKCPKCGNVDRVTKEETIGKIHCQTCYHHYNFGE